MFTTGEGGVSTGSMVPVYDVREAARAPPQRVALEAPEALGPAKERQTEAWRRNEPRAGRTPPGQVP